MKYEIKPETQRLKHPTITKMSPFSIYCFLFLLIPKFLSHSSISISVHRSLGQRLISHLWKKNSAIESEYIPTVICFTCLHVHIPTSHARRWSNSMQINPFFQKIQPSSNCGLVGITLS